MRLRHDLLLGLCAALTLAACDFLTDPVALDAFAYVEAAHGTEVTPTISAQGFSREILFAGQLNTPTPCYRLSGDLKQEGSRLELKITATSNTTTCEAILGSFRYEGSIRGLKPGTYEFRVQHVFPGTTMATFQETTSIVVR